MQSFIAQKNEKLSKSCLNNVGGLSYNVFSRLLKDKDIKVNNKRVSKDILVSLGDKIDVYWNVISKPSYTKIFEDENILVINKNSGYTSESVFSELSKNYRKIYFIHRLDRNTNGLMIFALNNITENELLNGFKKHSFIKEYRAEVFGKLKNKQDIMTAYLVKDSEKSLVKIYDNAVRNSVQIKTGYKVLEEKEKTTIVLVRLYTGKTHQIRAHFAHIGNFIVGDSKYGNDVFNKQMGIKEQQLSSYKLTLIFEKDSPLFYLNSKTFCIE